MAAVVSPNTRLVTTEIRSSSSGGGIPFRDEGDEWVDVELEKARASRGQFYKKLTNGRTAAMARDMDPYGQASEVMSRSGLSARSSAERELSGSPHPSGIGSATPLSPGIPEPHSSWRFYTSYDNGEWKRHCVPVKKPEEDLTKPHVPSGESKESSPAYESHLKKYRQARASMFDRTPRRRTSSTEGVSMPRAEQTVSLRRSVGGNNVGGGGGGSCGLAAVNFPFAEPNMHQLEALMRSGKEVVPAVVFGDDGAGLVPVEGMPRRRYHEETSTSETVTTVSGGPGDNRTKALAITPDGKDASAVTPRRSSRIKEKIIIPSKYKNDGSGSGSGVEGDKEPSIRGISVSVDPFSNASTPLCSPLSGQMTPSSGEKKKLAEVDEGPLSFMGSTFEPFDFERLKSKPKYDSSSSKTHSIPSNNNASTKIVREKPCFENSPFSSQPPDNSMVKKPSFVSSPPFTSSFKETTTVTSAESSPIKHSTPIKVSNLSDRSMAPSTAVNESPKVTPVKPVFGTPSSSAANGGSAIESLSLLMKSDAAVPSFSTTSEASVDSADDSSFTNRRSAFTALTSMANNKDAPTVDGRPVTVSTKRADIVYIPVVRVVTGDRSTTLAPSTEPPGGRHTSELTMNVNEGERSMGGPVLGVVTMSRGAGAGAGAGTEHFPSNVLTLNEETKRWIDTEIARHSGSGTTTAQSSTVGPVDASEGRHSGEATSSGGVRGPEMGLEQIGASDGNRRIPQNERPVFATKSTGATERTVTVQGASSDGVATGGSFIGRGNSSGGGGARASSGGATNFGYGNGATGNDVTSNVSAKSSSASGGAFRSSVIVDVVDGNKDGGQHGGQRQIAVERRRQPVENVPARSATTTTAMRPPSPNDDGWIVERAARN